MKIFGFRIVREKGMQVGNHESALVDLQRRVNVLEHNQKVKVKEVEHVEVAQGEIEKILATGSVPQGEDMWAGL